MGKKHTQLVIFLCFGILSLRNFFAGVVMAQNGTIPVNVGVVLDMDTWIGKMGLTCISMALSDFYDSHNYFRTRLILHVRDSKGNVVGAAAAALDLLKNVGVEAIIGPVTSMQANFLINLGGNAQVPIISFSATSPFLSSLRSPYFIRATLNDSAQVKAISAVVQAFQWRRAVPIYADDEYGEGIIPSLIDALQETDVRMPYRSVINPLATDDEIVVELYKLMTMQTRVFIVHMSRSLAARLFTKAQEVGMMSKGYVWIITDGITEFLSLMDPVVLDSMQGVLGVKPHVPRRKGLEDFMSRWKRRSQQDNISADLNIFGLWAYDAARALVMAVEKVVGTKNSSFQKMICSGNSTDLDTVQVSKNGKDLSQVLAYTRFQGLSGDFHFVNGQLQSPAFQIVNVIGSGERGIGFWTPKNGIVKKLNVTNKPKYTTSRVNLKAIVWPGDSVSVPMGWEMPENGKKLSIGVPVKDGFTEFVSVTIDPITNKTKVDGYCINVFNAVMKSLPYAVLYDFSPFANPNGGPAGCYDELVDQVSLENYDAVVGDVTIIANRSLYVDFTLPFTESGVVMVVPFNDKKKKDAWIFLQPLTWDLWLTSACSFIFIGMVIWIIERGKNEDYKGSTQHQLGLSFWFSFSTMVFAHKDKVVSNLARFVVIIWCFVVLILTQSYTASLTSMLTTQQLVPSVTNIDELVNNGESVAYQEGSFVHSYLKQFFLESKLAAYNSQEELHAAFSNGSIAAAFDEIPYMKLFLATFCRKYKMVEPTQDSNLRFLSPRTGGFGFVFPKGSPLVPDVSRSILDVTEGKQMTDIEKNWFGQSSRCSDDTSETPSSRLRIGSFWGLFLVVGASSSLAVIICLAMLLYEHRHFFIYSDPPDTLRITSNTSENEGVNSNIASSDTSNPPRASSALSSDVSGEQGAPLAECHSPNASGRQSPEIVPAVEIVQSSQNDMK